MNAHYLYLTIDILAVSLPFAFSFHPKLKFYKKWKYLWISTLVPGILFLVWDEIFTRMGVWGFNPVYLTGFYIGHLPAEEVLFFLCIPYACIFSYFALSKIVPKYPLTRYQRSIGIILSLVLIAAGCYLHDKLYSLVTFTSLGIFLIVETIFFKASYLGRFYISYIFILLPFFVVNGILTGSFIEGEVVWYNPKENMGIRIGTIPLEDIFYGMLLLLLNVAIFERMQKKDNRILPK